MCGLSEVVVMYIKSCTLVVLLVSIESCTLEVLLVAIESCTLKVLLVSRILSERLVKLRTEAFAK